MRWSPSPNAWGFTTLITFLLIQSTEALSIRDAYHAGGRERLSLNHGWRFMRSTTNPDGLIYDLRPEPSEQDGAEVLKPWILPSGNDFIADPENRHELPDGNPGGDVPFVQTSFDDAEWEGVDLPHDWAIKGPFYTEEEGPVVGGGMGRLPVQGVAWYRRKIEVGKHDKGKSVFLDIDGAMSYAMVWVNGYFVGGWPYPYNSFRLDITPYLEVGGENQLAIRLDNPVKSARWYPGGGLYRNIWLTKVDSVHVGQWGTFITSRDISAESATVDLVVQIENKGEDSRKVEVATDLHVLDLETGKIGEKVAQFKRETVSVPAGESKSINGSTSVENPKLWGPVPSQTPNMYATVTRVYARGEVIDTYETHFGIRTIAFDGSQGLLVNGEHIRIQGVNQHHDLGALGAAFNLRAAERQLEVLHDLGCNAIRMAHNPPAPELLDLTDRMGFIVMDEIFDSWQQNKTTNDFHLIFDDWYEADLRSVLRRDRNHPSITIWSVGNEVGEQYTDTEGAAIARKLVDIVHEEDPTRPSTASMNYAKPDMPFPLEFEVLSLNYQGEGIRDAPAYDDLEGITTPPQYGAFHDKFPERVLLASESAAAVSSRGTFIFPVTNESSAPASDELAGGGDPDLKFVSAYELYTADFGSSADKVFAAQDSNPFVAGEFVWSGWDYIGEPTPYYTSRSSYFGIIDLAGFKKERYHLYQARWRPDLKTAHILPHWTWDEDRVGEVTPVHVFSAADEAELFLNGESLGKRSKEASNYRFRWDEVVYEPGELRVVTYKDGEEWAESTVKTAGEAAGLRLIPDRGAIKGDGVDLSFVTVEVVDGDGNVVPTANDEIMYSVSGPAEIVATDNGDPTDMTSFASKERKAFNGLGLVIIRSEGGKTGRVTVTAKGKGLRTAKVSLTVGK
ncbi:hypothetical protein FQN53_006610 [Emmonsiellopsis sp. PD_33]|nr:hypothetical protein FQN53_006610 [Emmonsiellopsis sp. PD_33]